VDALSDDTKDQVDTTIGYEGRAKVEARLRQLEGGSFGSPDGNLKSSKTAKYDAVAAKTSAAAPAYNDASDMVMDVEATPNKSEKKKKKDKESSKKKRKAESPEEEEKSAKKAKKEKKKKEKKSKS
jgi:nucleolar protein 58